MEQTSPIHLALKSRNKSVTWPYFSSIMVVNKDVPLLETRYGMLDYEWLLEVTKYRKCVEVDPCVVRYVHNKNLSHDETYRDYDFFTILALTDDPKVVMSVYGTKGRYHYYMGQMKKARHHFMMAKLDWKIALYILTSYIPPLAKIISRKFNIFG